MLNFLLKLYLIHLNHVVEKFAYKYHFDMGKDGRTSYNNEGDAFKHCFMQAELTLILGSWIAEYIGLKHEDNNPLNNFRERNMDLWNNRIGRAIGNRLRKNIFSTTFTELPFLIAEEIVTKMRSGELITDPNDTRRFS